MTNREFLDHEETIRTLCDDMSPRQVKSIITTLRMDLEDRGDDRE